MSLLAALGLALLAFTAVLWPFVYQIVPDWYARSSSGSFGDYEWIYEAIGFCHSVVDGSIMMLVLFAIFSSRRQPERWAPAAEVPRGNQYSLDG